jgi:hypothetical protein
MTRKDFEMIAGAMAKAARWSEAKAANTTSPEYAQGRSVGIWLATHNLADVLAETNPAFDRERFLKAAGAES